MTETGNIDVIAQAAASDARQMADVRIADLVRLIPMRRESELLSVADGESEEGEDEWPAYGGQLTGFALSISTGADCRYGKARRAAPSSRRTRFIIK